MVAEQKELYVQCAKNRKDFDIQQSKILLQNIGYKYDSEYSIHEQFLIKHNLVK
jgi:hypothetical protein